MLTIGTHMSIAGGIAKTAENVVKMEADTMQIFSRNPRGSNYKTYTEEEIGKFQKIRKEHGFVPPISRQRSLEKPGESMVPWWCLTVRRPGKGAGAEDGSPLPVPVFT